MIRGITQYEPSEFTFTALAGTRVSEITAALAEKNQYLPFDPMLVDAGATIGGTVGAGLSGPGRLRYGGIRDFVLGVHFISGDGKLIRAGGKVVKNAAGFDLPKFMVGSLGRYGVITELTFKVFPKPSASETLRVSCQSHFQAIERIAHASASSWELDAIDYRTDQQTIYLRIAGPSAANRAIAAEIRNQWGGDVADADNPNDFWRSVRELNWIADAPTAVKIPTTPDAVLQLCDRLPGHLHFSVAANVAWLLLDTNHQLADTAKSLSANGLKGLVVTGNCSRSCIGTWISNEIDLALKRALDPAGIFPLTNLDSHAKNETARER